MENTEDKQLLENEVRTESKKIVSNQIEYIDIGYYLDWDEDEVYYEDLI